MASLMRSRLSGLTTRTPTAVRASFSSSTRFRMPYKDSQDRESLRPSSTENTKSTRDDNVANTDPDAAFNPNKTRPEEEEGASLGGSSKGEDGTVLEASGANQELSKPRGDEKSSNDRGVGEEVRKGGKSEGKSAEKKGRVKGN